MNQGNASSGNVLLSWERLEEKPIGFFRYTVFLYAIIITRNILEAFSGTGFTEQPGSYLLHYPLAYITPLLALSSVLAILSKVPVIKVTRLILYVWLLTLLPPLLDLLISTGLAQNGAQIGYLPVEEGAYWTTFINFFNPYVNLKGTTIGIRLEAFLACLLSFLYVYIKSKSLLRSIITPFIIFAVSFFFFTFPNVYLALTKLLNPDVKDFSDLFLSNGILSRTDTSKLSLIMAQVDLILLAIVIIFWFGLHKGLNGIRQLIRLFSSSSAVFAAAMVLLGFVIGWRVILPFELFANLLSHHSDFMSLISLLLAAIAASAAVSCLEQERIPRREGCDRFPSRELMFFLTVFASLNALVVGFAPFCFLLIYLSACLFRDSYPFELKRVPVLSALVTTLGYVALISMGYCLFAGSRTPSYFPRGVLTVLFVSLLAGVFAGELVEHDSEPSGTNRKKHLVLFEIILLCIAYLIPVLYFTNLPLLIASVTAAVLSSIACLHRRARIYFGIICILYIAVAVNMLFFELRYLKKAECGTPRQIRHAELASMYLSQGSSEHARVEYETASDLGSPDPSIYYGLGFDYSQKGNDLMAIEMFRRAAELDSTYAEAYYNLALSYINIDMDQEAISNFMRATTLAPQSQEIELGSAGTLLRKGYPEEALSIILENLGETADEQIMIFEILNTISRQRSANAVDTSLVSGNFLGKFTVAMQRASSARWKEALDEIILLEEEFPEVQVLSYYKAWINQMAGNTEVAIGEYKKLLEKFPGMYQPMINLGAAYLTIGKLDESRNISVSILSENPGDVKALVNLANSYTKEGKLERSLEFLSRALKENTEDYGVRMNLAIVLEGLSRIDEAIIQYQTILLRNKQSPEVYTRLSGCYLRKGDDQKARESLEQALRLNPDYKPALKALSMISKQSSDSKSGMTP